MRVFDFVSIAHVPLKWWSLFIRNNSRARPRQELARHRKEPRFWRNSAQLTWPLASARFSLADEVLFSSTQEHLAKTPSSCQVQRLKGLTLRNMKRAIALKSRQHTKAGFAVHTERRKKVFVHSEALCTCRTVDHSVQLDQNVRHPRMEFYAS